MTNLGLEWNPKKEKIPLKLWGSFCKKEISVVRKSHFDEIEIEMRSDQQDYLNENKFEFEKGSPEVSNTKS